MVRKTDIKNSSDKKYSVVMSSRGSLKTIRERGVREPLSCYIAAVQMGHTGHGYSMAKVVSILAKDDEEFRRRVADIPRTKRDRPGFILSYTIGSVKEGKLVRMLNNYDPFMNGVNIGSESVICQNERMIHAGVLRGKIEKREEFSHKDFKTADDYSEKDVIQKAYAAYIVESGDENNRRLRVKENDKPLEGQLLYDYFKQHAIRAVKKYKVKPRDRFQMLLYYARIVPKYKKCIQADDAPFKVFFEKLEPDDTRDVVAINFLYRDRESNDYYEEAPTRVVGTEQYALCYRNLDGVKISLLVPDDFVSSILKHPSKEDVETYVQNKIQDNERLHAYDPKEISELVYEVLSNDRVDVSHCDTNLKIIVNEMACHFSECEYANGMLAIKKAKWENAYDGEFLSESFYEKTKDVTSSITDEEYRKFMAEKNAKMRAKFDRFKAPAKNEDKDPEPGDE